MNLPTPQIRKHSANAPRGARRLRGFAASLSALVGLVAVGAVGFAGSEIAKRRVFYEIEMAALDESVLAMSIDSSNVTAELRRGATPGIAMIGDSWISKSKFDEPLAAALGEIGLGGVPVRGIGQGGATSRKILRNLLSTEDSETASGVLLQDGLYQYCVVVAGVNDSAQHLGDDFYAHHVMEIVRILLAHDVTPVVVELPEYGIEDIREQRQGINWLKDVTLAALFDQNDLDVVSKYRAALRVALEDSGLMNEVELVSFEPVVADYHTEMALYQDAAHLNEEGRSIFADHVAAAIAGRMERDGVLPSGASVRVPRFASNF